MGVRFSLPVINAAVTELCCTAAVLVFRGTEPLSLTDWIKDDLDFPKLKPTHFTNCDNCMVHAGFYDSYMVLRPGILSAFAQLGILPGSTVWVTGHSLGAAMASIAMFDLQGQGYHVQQSYTFGQPRVGNAAYYAAFTSQLGAAGEFRVVHNCDPVPHLPLQLMGFHHVATEVWYDEGQEHFSICDGSGEDPACSKCLLPVDIFDHLNYVHVPMATLCGIPVNATQPTGHLRG
jgi:predicted lipase